MNTVNEMGQLIVSCDFDVRKTIYTPQSGVNSVLLVKLVGEEENRQMIHVILSHENENNEIIQVDVVITDKDGNKIDEYMLVNDGDAEECITLLNRLDFNHRRMSDVTYTLEYLADTRVIGLNRMMNVVEYEDVTYTSPYITNPIALFAYAIDFNLHIDPRFKYTLFVGRDKDKSMDLGIYDTRDEGRTEENITLDDLKAHLIWAEDRISDYLQNLPDIIYDDFTPSKD